MRRISYTRKTITIRAYKEDGTDIVAAVAFFRKRDGKVISNREYCVNSHALSALITALHKRGIPPKIDEYFMRYGDFIVTYEA